MGLNSTRDLGLGKARDGRDPTSMLPSQSEAAAADTGAAGPGKKMAARHSPVTLPPSPPPSASRVVRCLPSLSSHATPRTQAEAQDTDTQP